MSLKIKTPLRLKALFAGVALSKKTVDAISDQLLKAGLTDEATDEEIDTKLNERNALFSFEDQKKFDDYQVGKATKEAADKEALRLKAIADGLPAPVEIDPNETATDKALRLIMEKLEKQDLVIASFGTEKVTNTRKQLYEKALEGTPDAFKAKALKDFNKMKFETDDEFTEFLNESETDVADFIQQESNNGLTNQQPVRGVKIVPGQIKVASETELDAVMTHL